MKTFMIAASAIALATPALAQMTGGTTTTGTTGAASGTTTTGSTTTPSRTPPATTPVAPSSAEPATSDTMGNQTDTGTTTTGTATAATTVAKPTDPKAVIASEFPTYDKDGNGSLNTVEFGAWMTALKTASGATPLPAAEQTTWLKGAFTSADKDKNKAVSQTELTTYLTAGA